MAVVCGQTTDAVRFYLGVEAAVSCPARLAPFMALGQDIRCAWGPAALPTEAASGVPKSNRTAPSHQWDREPKLIGSKTCSSRASRACSVTLPHWPIGFAL